jgi:hypothetical protein
MAVIKEPEKNRIAYINKISDVGTDYCLWIPPDGIEFEYGIDSNLRGFERCQGMKCHAQLR